MPNYPACADRLSRVTAPGAAPENATTLPPRREPANGAGTHTLNGHASILTRLTAAHLADLQKKSGLSDEQIECCGFYSLQAPESVKQRLRWKKYNGALGDCLCIPFTDASGNPTGYARLKPDRPRRQKDGKPVKYESPKGAKNRAYFPPGTRAVVVNPSLPLVFTEGEKKAAKADQEGIPCIGLVGVYGGKRNAPRNPTASPRASAN